MIVNSNGNSNPSPMYTAPGSLVISYGDLRTIDGELDRSEAASTHAADIRSDIKSTPRSKSRQRGVDAPEGVR
jgi:hypothetical protein